MFIKREYGRILIGTLFLVTIFAIAGLIVFGFTLDLWYDEQPLISKVGTGTSIMGVFLGTFIAIWLMNRDRIKKIEEQHVYKVDILHNLSSLVISVQQGLFHAKTSGNTPTEIVKFADNKIDDYKYWGNLILGVNNNDRIPPKIRDSVRLFLQQGIKPLTSIMTASNDTKFVETTFLEPLDRIIDSDFLTKDNDDSVKHFLKTIKHARKTVKDTNEGTHPV